MDTSILSQITLLNTSSLAFSVANFEPAGHFETEPKMVQHSYNRLTSQQLSVGPPLSHTPEAIEVTYTALYS